MGNEAAGPEDREFVAGALMRHAAQQLRAGSLAVRDYRRLRTFAFQLRVNDELRRRVHEFYSPDPDRSLDVIEAMVRDTPLADLLTAFRPPAHH